MASLYDLLGSVQPSRMGMIEGDPEYDPWSMQAARIRARYPTRGGGIGPTDASMPAGFAGSGVGFSDLPGYEEARHQAGNVYAGEAYNPSSLVQMALGAVGAPGMVSGVPAGALGSGVGRMKTAMHPPAVATPDLPPIRAYHGSPYDFERFDLSKIGTGEGAQMYGHGLYFAENPKVAQEYRDVLTRRSVNAAEILPSTTGNALFDIAEKTGGLINGKIPFGPTRSLLTREQIVSGFEQGKFSPYDLPPAVQRQIVDQIKPPGRMYEVNIRAQPEQFLDWDKPVAEQGRLLDTVADIAAAARVPLGNSATGQTAYKALAERYARGSLTAGKPIASEIFREAGIPGIRYLDQGSRNAGGSQTRNYTLFRNDIIDIVKKYGWAGLAAFGISQDDAKAAGVEPPHN